MKAQDWTRYSTPLLYLGVAVGVTVFAWSGLRSDRGPHALTVALAEEARLEAELAAISARRAAAENRVARLRTDYLDLDLLDERARAVLGYARPDEVLLDPVTR